MSGHERAMVPKKQSAESVRLGVRIRENFERLGL